MVCNQEGRESNIVYVSKGYNTQHQYGEVIDLQGFILSRWIRGASLKEKRRSRLRLDTLPSLPKGQLAEEIFTVDLASHARLQRGSL